MYTLSLLMQQMQNNKMHTSEDILEKHIKRAKDLHCDYEKEADFVRWKWKLQNLHSSQIHNYFRDLEKHLD